MILPFITAITRDVFLTVPVMLRESAYGMGMTTWEVVRHIVIPYTRRALVGGVMLGLGRALGETMAVTFVIGNSHRIAPSLLAPATTISAVHRQRVQRGDARDLYTSSLVTLGLILFVITFTVLALAKWMLGRSGNLLRPWRCDRTIRPTPPQPDRIRRRRRNRIALALSVVAAGIGLFFLAAILFTLLWNGLRPPSAPRCSCR